MGSVCIRVWEMPDTFTIFYVQTQERKQEHKRNKRQVRLLTAWNNEDLSLDQTNETFNC